MKKVLVILLSVMCSLGVAFGQLRVTNNFGHDLNIAVNNGTKQLVPNKGTKTFDKVRGRTVWLECQTIDAKTKFTVPKNPTRSGMVWIEPGDGPAVVNNPAPSVTTYSQQPQQGVAQPSSQSVSFQDIIKQKTPATQAAPPASSASSVANTQRTAPTPTYTAPSSVSAPVTPAPTIALEPIKVIYTASERCKVFSDIGGSNWQGIEFRGKAVSDSLKDNAKNEYNLFIQKDRDLHIGVVFDPQSGINRYGEFRKRVNKGDAELYINEGDIQKMSTSETKPVRIRLMAKDYKIYFDPGDTNSKGEKDPISLEFKRQSRAFMAPIGQFYIKASCTDASGMIHPTVYIPVHVTNSDNVIVITTDQLNKALGSDLNLDWSKLRKE